MPPMRSIPPIKAVMTPFPYWVETTDTLERAKVLMLEHDIRHLPVMEDGKLVSVLSERDMRSAPAARLVRDACLREVYVVGLTEPLDRVLMHMAERHIGSALVVKEGKLAGIFTTTDACRTFGQLLRSLFPKGGDDAA
jgi:acetoin utilization protein AcuB